MITQLYSASSALGSASNRCCTAENSNVLSLTRHYIRHYSMREKSINTIFGCFKLLLLCTANEPQQGRKRETDKQTNEMMKERKGSFQVFFSLSSFHPFPIPFLLHLSCRIDNIETQGVDEGGRPGCYSWVRFSGSWRVREFKPVPWSTCGFRVSSLALWQPSFSPSVLSDPTACLTPD